MEDTYVLLDLERTIGSGIAHYWKQNRHGYTQDIHEAGKFSKETAEEIVNSDFDKLTVAVPMKQLTRLHII
ncbi:MAG: hypothetical protein ACI35P_15075 [Bacillus sp. (in: firmicutes)]